MHSAVSLTCSHTLSVIASVYAQWTCESSSTERSIFFLRIASVLHFANSKAIQVDLIINIKNEVVKGILIPQEVLTAECL